MNFDLVFFKKLVSNYLYHINISKMLYDANKLYTKYVPSDNGDGIFCFVMNSDKIQNNSWFFGLNVYRNFKFSSGEMSHYVDGDVTFDDNQNLMVVLNLYISNIKNEYILYDDIILELYEVLSHEMSHIQQFLEDSDYIKRRKSELKRVNNSHQYYLILDEKKAIIESLNFKSKIKNSLFENELNKFLNIQKCLGNIQHDRVNDVKKELVNFNNNYYE